MDKNTKTIILLALLGFGAMRFLKAKSVNTPPAPASEELFVRQVKALQKFLNVKVDGIPAGETNGALKTQFGLPYGNVKPENITKYLNDLHISF